MPPAGDPQRALGTNGKPGSTGASGPTRRAMITPGSVGWVQSANIEDGDRCEEPGPKAYRATPWIGPLTRMSGFGCAANHPPHRATQSMGRAQLAGGLKLAGRPHWRQKRHPLARLASWQGSPEDPCIRTMPRQQRVVSSRRRLPAYYVVAEAFTIAAEHRHASSSSTLHHQ